MTIDQLKKICYDDFEFTYNGKLGSICPLSKYSVTYNGDTQDFDDIDTALSAPMFDGKSLLEIADEIEY